MECARDTESFSVISIKGQDLLRETGEKEIVRVLIRNIPKFSG